MSWVCVNGHSNFNDQSVVCGVCGGVKESRVDARAWFSLMLGLFFGPVYPIAGGLSWAAAIGVYYGSGLVGIPFDARWPLMAVVALVLFYVLFNKEKAASRSGAYRLARDIIRIAAGLFILIGVIGNNHFPPAENIGLALLLPAVLLLAKRLDQVLDVGKPDGQRGRFQTPDWLTDFIDASNWRAAQFAGLGAGMLGFALGRDARVLSAIVLYLAAMLLVMLVSGGAAALRKGGPIVKGALGATGGGVLGYVFLNNDLGAIIGAIAAALILPQVWK